MSGKRKRTDEEAEDDRREYSSVICKWGARVHLRRSPRGNPAVLSRPEACPTGGWDVDNLHLLRCFKDSIELLNLDRVFFYRCCAGVLLSENEDDPLACKELAPNKTLLAYRRDRQLVARYTASQFDTAPAALNELSAQECALTRRT